MDEINEIAAGVPEDPTTPMSDYGQIRYFLSIFAGGSYNDIGLFTGQELDVKLHELGLEDEHIAELVEVGSLEDEHTGFYVSEIPQKPQPRGNGARWN